MVCYFFEAIQELCLAPRDKIMYCKKFVVHNYNEYSYTSNVVYDVKKAAPRELFSIM